MRWPTAQAIAALSPLPNGYRYAQFGRADIAPLMSSVKDWHPSIAVGVNSCYLREDFYLRRVSLDGDLERDVIVVRILHDENLVGF